MVMLTLHIESKYKVNVDKCSRDLAEIPPHRIRTYKDKDWGKLGQVLDKCTEPRLYVLNSKGNRHKCRYLIPTNELFISDEL